MPEALDEDPPGILTPSEQIATTIRRRIEVGKYEPGDRLPSVNALAAEFGVARATVNRAIKILIDDGWVATRERWGMFVRSRLHGCR